MTHQSDSIVIIPTYNEKENIEKIIRAIFGLEKCFHILIIDDGSPDGTAAIVKETGIGNRLYQRLQVGTGARLPVHLRDGCRLQPRPQRPAPPLFSLC